MDSHWRNAFGRVGAPKVVFPGRGEEVEFCVGAVIDETPIYRVFRARAEDLERWPELYGKILDKLVERLDESILAMERPLL